MAQTVECDTRRAWSEYKECASMALSAPKTSVCRFSCFQLSSVTSDICLVPKSSTERLLSEFER